MAAKSSYARQVVILDNINDLVCGGILLENGDVICAHCGYYIDKSRVGDSAHDFSIIDRYESWIDLSPRVCMGSRYYNEEVSE